MAFCGNCGAAMGDNDKFCGKCGASAVGSGSPSAADNSLMPGGTIKAPFAPGAGQDGAAAKLTSALPDGEVFASPSSPAAAGLGSKITSALPNGEAFAAQPPSTPNEPASKLTSALPDDGKFADIPNLAANEAESKMTSLLNGDNAGADKNNPFDPYADTPATVALLNVTKRPGYEASNAYLEGKDSAASAGSGSNPFGSSATPFGGGTAETGKNDSLPVFGAGAAASAAFSSAGSAEAADTPKGYPFGETNNGSGLKSSELGPFSGGPAAGSLNQGVIGLKNDNDDQAPVTLNKPGGAIVGNTENRMASVPAAAPVNSLMQGEDGSDIKDYLFTSIFVFFCCCQPCGVASIVFSALCRSKKGSGDFEDARKMAGYAKISNLVGLIGGFLICLLYIVFVVLNN